jgi:predicted RNA-binding Zn ribbon-like protein
MSGDHPRFEPPVDGEELFVAFANTLDLGEPQAALPEQVEALTAWLEAHGLLDARERVGQRSRLRRDRRQATLHLDRFRELRGVTRAIADRTDANKRPSRAQLRDLNRALRDGLHYHQLQPSTDGSRYTVTQVGDRLDQARASIAGSLAHFLADHDASRLRVCDHDRCLWLFVDSSPAGRRRCGDMRVCGNRAKVARHRARRRSTAPA